MAWLSAAAPQNLLRSLCTDLSLHWLNLFLSDFIVFEAIVNGSVFFISFSGILMLVHKNAADS